MRRFRKANSGVVFEFYQKEAKLATPVIFLLASDASYSGQHRSHQCGIIPYTVSQSYIQVCKTEYNVFVCKYIGFVCTQCHF
jgi:hypothetical protein